MSLAGNSFRKLWMDLWTAVSHVVVHLLIGSHFSVMFCPLVVQWIESVIRFIQQPRIPFIAMHRFVQVTSNFAPSFRQTFTFAKTSLLYSFSFAVTKFLCYLYMGTSCLSKVFYTPNAEGVHISGFISMYDFGVREEGKPVSTLVVRFR